MATTPVEHRILELCRKHPQGVSDAIFDAELTGVSIESRAEGINALLSKHLLQIFRKGDSLLYCEQNKEEAGRLRGLSSEELLVYQIIQQSTNMGIWTRDLKARSNLQQPQVAKILKALEGRRLIKAVKSVAAKNRKVYMLSEVEPSREITGGAWYTEHEFDAEFIDALRTSSLQYIIDQEPVTLEDIAAHIKNSNLTKEDLSLDDYEQVVKTLVFDSEVDELTSYGTVRDAFPAGTKYYKPARVRVPESTNFTNVPCGVCPVIEQCTDDGLISPKTCVYFKEWLTF